ncbi:MAG: hypothetical protein QM699_18600 [Amaricoccus sp.]|uniref:hypothetical protein n=1 Tax=Amaricoccus sp. TaxID=1872485 RepID=UPI0039E6352F
MPEDRFVPSIYRSSEQRRAFGPRAGMLLGLLTGFGLAAWVYASGAGLIAAFLAYSFGASLTLFAVVAFASLRPAAIIRRAAAPLHFHRI